MILRSLLLVVVLSLGLVSHLEGFELVSFEWNHQTSADVGPKPNPGCDRSSDSNDGDPPEVRVFGGRLGCGISVSSHGLISDVNQVSGKAVSRVDNTLIGSSTSIRSEALTRASGSSASRTGTFRGRAYSDVSTTEEDTEQRIAGTVSSTAVAIYDFSETFFRLGEIEIRYELSASGTPDLLPNMSINVFDHTTNELLFSDELNNGDDIGFFIRRNLSTLIPVESLGGETLRLEFSADSIEFDATIGPPRAFNLRPFATPRASQITDLDAIVIFDAPVPEPSNPTAFVIFGLLAVAQLRKRRRIRFAL